MRKLFNNNEINIDTVRKEKVALLLRSGKEFCSPDPVAVPAGLNKPLSLQEQIQRCLRTALSNKAEQNGFETEEEANDFDIDDPFDVEPNSGYEVSDMIEEDFDPDPGDNTKLTMKVDSGPNEAPQNKKKLLRPEVETDKLNKEADDFILVGKKRYQLVRETE